MGPGLVNYYPLYYKRVEHIRRFGSNQAERIRKLSH